MIGFKIVKFIFMLIAFYWKGMELQNSIQNHPERRLENIKHASK